MTNLGTTILADEQLQDIVDPFDLFHKPETDPHHIDSKWVTARPKLHLPDEDGPIYIEVNNFDGNHHGMSTWCLQSEFEMLGLHKKEPNLKTDDSYVVSLINNFPAALCKKITVSYALEAQGYYIALTYFSFFSTSHVIPHIRVLVPCPGLTFEAWAVSSTSVPLTPTEILNLVFL